MRWVVELIAGLSLVGAVGAGAVVFRQSDRSDERAEQVASELRRLQLEVKYRAATEKAELNPWGWPVTIDPEWFGEDPPTNSLLGPEHPWVEVAGDAELGLMHPKVRLALDPGAAGFWYNPTTGAVRARVPMRMSDERTLALYNAVNGESLSDLFAVEHGRTIPVPAPPRGSTPAEGEPSEGAVADPQSPEDGGEVDESIFYEQAAQPG